MTKKTFFISTIFLFLTCASFSQITFQKTFCFAGLYFGGSILQTNDNGFIILSNDSINANDYDICLIKTNTVGDTIWSRKFGGAGIDIGSAIQQTSDNGYIITGFTNSFGTSSSDVYLIKTDNLGNILWSKTFHKSQYTNDGISVLQTNDGGYLIGGVSYNPSYLQPNSRNCYLIRTDISGNLIWDKIIGDYAVCKCISKTNDGGFIFSGFIMYNETDVWKAYLFKSDGNGNILWRKTFGSIDGTEGTFVQQTSDSGFIITGLTQNFGAGLNDVLLIKTNFIGDTLWTKTYGGIGNDNGSSVQQTSDGGYIIVGETSSFGNGDWDIYLIRTDSIGDTLWTRAYGGTSSEIGIGVKQCFDGGYVINGLTKSFGDNHSHAYIIKTDINGNTGCYENYIGTIVNSTSLSVGNDMSPIYSGTTVFNPATIVSRGVTENTICTSAGLNEISKNNLIEIFPNPFYLQTTLQTDYLLTDATMTIYNTIGQQVKQIKNIFGNTITLYRDNLLSGLYILRLTQDNKVLSTDKIIITDD